MTNWTTMKARIERLKDLERMESSGSIAMRPKRSCSIKEELERLQKYLGGLKGMKITRRSCFGRSEKRI